MSSDRAKILTLYDGWNRILPSVGRLGHGMFLVAALSGVVLVLPYDVQRPFQSLQEMALGDPGGHFFRALHYWSGQLCLVLVVLHVVEHLLARNEKLVSFGLWLRLVVSIPLMFLILLSGFMLRGDAEGVMARRVGAGLLETIPLAGNAVSLLLLGSGDDLQVVYAHHLALLTILVLLILVEHSRPFWPSWATSLVALSSTTVLALLGPPGLHLPWDPVVKGPWYFLGLQELLHWTSRPGWVVIAGFILLAGLALLPKLGQRTGRAVHWILLGMLLFYAVLTIVAWQYRGPGWVLTWS